MTRVRYNGNSFCVTHLRSSLSDSKRWRSTSLGNRQATTRSAVNSRVSDDISNPVLSGPVLALRYNSAGYGCGLIPSAPRHRSVPVQSNSTVIGSRRAAYVPTRIVASPLQCHLGELCRLEHVLVVWLWKLCDSPWSLAGLLTGPERVENLHKQGDTRHFLRLLQLPTLHLEYDGIDSLWRMIVYIPAVHKARSITLLQPAIFRDGSYFHALCILLLMLTLTHHTFTLAQVKES